MGADIGDDVVIVNPSEAVKKMKRVPRVKLTTINESGKAIAERQARPTAL